MPRPPSVLPSMTPFPRRGDVRPLSPEIEGLLRGLPRAEPPHGLRTRLLAVHASREPRSLGLWHALRTGWRPAFVSGGLTAAAVVAVFLGASGVRPAERQLASADVLREMVAVHPLPQGLAPARVVSGDRVSGEPASGAAALESDAASGLLDGP